MSDTNSEERVTMSDRENARNRELEFERINKKCDLVVGILAISVIAIFFFLSIVITFVKLDQSNHDVLYIMIGQLTGGFIMVLSYYFGSSNPMGPPPRPQQ